MIGLSSETCSSLVRRGGSGRAASKVNSVPAGPLAIAGAWIGLVETAIRGELTAHELRALAPLTPEYPPQQSTARLALIRISGVLTRTRSIFSVNGLGTALVEVSGQLRRALGDQSVRSVVLDVDSPGGITELHAEILKARRTKPVTAHVSGMAASAAYHLASAAQEITATPSAMLGSIGVIGVHIESSRRLKQHGLGITLKTAGKFKGDASGLVPLSADGGRELQRRVDHAYHLMVNDIAKGRRMSASEVRLKFGDARMVNSAEAVRLGMADRVATLAQTIERVSLPSRGIKARDAMAFRERVRVEIEARRYRLRMARRRDDYC